MKIAIILAGGEGNRFGSPTPKQYVQIDGLPILMYSVRTFLCSPIIDKIIIAMSPNWAQYINNYISTFSQSIKTHYCAGGATRWDSLKNALNMAKEIGAQNKDVIYIHDGARPIVKTRIIEDLLDSLDTYDAAIPTLPSKETVYISANDKEITGLTRRSELFIGQTPECFRFGQFYSALFSFSDNELANITGSSEIAYLKGLSLGKVVGDETSFKITTKSDLDLFQSLINNSHK